MTRRRLRNTGRILESGKYSEFIAYKNRLIEQSDYSDDTKRLMIETNNMLLQVNPEGEELTRELREVVQGINSYANYMTMAMEGMSDAGKLTDDEIEEMRLTAQEIKLSIDINAVGYGAAQSKDELGYAKNVIAIGTAVASVIIILISATMISEEIQSGSIKALIISPVKRSKIFAAKLMAIVTVCLLMIALIALTFTAINIIFGFGSSPIVYTAFGRAHSIAYYPYMFARIAIAFIDIFVYASMALMFSAITRNSAVSICITMFDYLAVSNIVKIICCNTDTITGNLVALFMPKVNMELAERLFRQMLPQSESGSLLELLTGGSDCAYGPLWFSIVYLAVLTFCFLYIAFDSFCRRDIK